MSSLRTKNVIKYVVPTILGNVCMALFTIVDSIFVGHGVGTDALGSLNLIGPFILAANALMMLINIGGATTMAIHIGKGDTDGVNKVFRHGMFAMMCLAILITALGVFFTEEICILSGAGETHLQMAVDYLYIYSLFFIPSGLSFALQSYCRNDGAPGLVGITVFISTACNIFLDWLLIFPFDMGVKGAAIATGIAQTLGLFIMLIHFIRKQGVLRFGKTKLQGSLFKDIVVRGFPEGVNQLATPMMVLCMNLVLAEKIGDIGVNAFSIIYFITSFATSVFTGASAGLQPLFGQSYGAKKEKDIKYYYKMGLGICGFGSILVTVLLILLCRPISILFGSDAVTLEYIAKVMPQFSLGFVALAFNVMISAYLYSTERSMQSTIISILRSLIVSPIIIVFLPEVFGVNIIWFTFLIYEAIVVIVSFTLLKHSERNGIVFK